MRLPAWNRIRKTLPQSSWVLLSAAAFGLCHGSFYLGKSLDLATAIGIVDFVSICFGPWLAVALHRLLMRGYAIWMAAILRRLEALTPRTETPVGPSEAISERATRSTFVAQTVGYSCFATAFFFGAAFAGLLMTLLTAQIDDHNYGPYLVATTVALIVAAGSIAAQCSYFSFIDFNVRSLEKELNRTGAVSTKSAPVAMRAKVIEKSVVRTEQLGSKFLSIRPLSSKHIAV